MIEEHVHSLDIKSLWRHVFVAVRWLACVFVLQAPSAFAQSIPFTFNKVGPEYRLGVEPTTAYYYGFQRSDDLLFFDTILVALGNPGPTFGYTPPTAERRAFFRAKLISISAPEDQDNDLIDDFWELQHSYLDPFNPNDAFMPSPEPDAGGRNNLDYFFWKRGTVRLREVHTREVSVFNFGTSTVGQEAISREISVFNGQSIPADSLKEVYSREVSAFNFGSNPSPVESISRAVSVFNGQDAPISGISEVYSRETSIYNFGSNPAAVEANSRAVSVFNGESAPTYGIPEHYARAISVYNFGADPAAVEVVSRAVSIYNGDGIPGPNTIGEVYSREATVFNFGSNPAAIEAISRAVSVLNTEP